MFVLSNSLEASVLGGMGWENLVEAVLEMDDYDDDRFFSLFDCLPKNPCCCSRFIIVDGRLKRNWTCEILSTMKLMRILCSRGAAGNKLRMTLGLPVYVYPRKQTSTPIFCYDEK